MAVGAAEAAGFVEAAVFFAFTTVTLHRSFLPLTLAMMTAVPACLQLIRYFRALIRVSEATPEREVDHLGELSVPETVSSKEEPSTACFSFSEREGLFLT